MARGGRGHRAGWEGALSLPGDGGEEEGNGEPCVADDRVAGPGAKGQEGIQQDAAEHRTADRLTPHRYQLHGFHVASTVALPFPDPHPPPRAELTIERRHAESDAAPPRTELRTLAKAVGDQAIDVALLASPEGEVLRYAGFADFIVHRDQPRITVVASSTADAAPLLLAHRLQGLPAARALLRMGHLPLHASAVRVPAGIVALLGPSGSGKSTLAAACALAGASPAADDLVALREHGQGWRASLAGPALRLSAASRTALGGLAAFRVVAWRASDRPYVVARGGASIWSGGSQPPLEGRMEEALCPLAAVLMLARSPRAAGAMELQPVAPAEATARLSASLWAASLLPPGQRAQAMARLATIATSVPTLRITLPADLARLPELAVRLLAELDERTGPISR